MNIHISGRERPINHDAPWVSESKLVFLGGLLGLAPSLRNGDSGQSLVEAAQVLQPQKPDSAADAEFIERELFVPEDWVL